MRLLYAASQGDLDELRAALATGCKPNAADYDGRTALHLAAAEGHLAAARFLLGSGPRQTPPTAERYAADGRPAGQAHRSGRRAMVPRLR